MEHKYAVKKRNMNNGTMSHVWQQKHDIDWDTTRVMCSKKYLWKRKVLEVIHTQQTVVYSSILHGSPL